MMKTLNDYLYETAVKNGYDTLQDCIEAYKYHIGKFVTDIAKEAAQAYAEAKYMEHIEICAEHAIKENCADCWIDKNSILNAPLATEGNKK